MGSIPSWLKLDAGSSGRKSLVATWYRSYTLAIWVFFLARAFGFNHPSACVAVEAPSLSDFSWTFRGFQLFSVIFTSFANKTDNCSPSERAHLFIAGPVHNLPTDHGRDPRPEKPQATRAQLPSCCAVRCIWLTEGEGGFLVLGNGVVSDQIFGQKTCLSLSRDHSSR